jgi:hypothetical protein
MYTALSIRGALLRFLISNWNDINLNPSRRLVGKGDFTGRDNLGTKQYKRKTPYSFLNTP